MQRETALSLIKNMEIWKDYYGYKVSNYGRILNRFGREVKGYIKQDRGYKYKIVVLRINKERTHLHLNSLVYRLFGKDYQENAKVYHIDGNIDNCDIDNLKISRAYTTRPTQEQIEVYEKNIISCVKDYFNKQGWLKIKNGFDVDNAICETYFQVYKYLPTFRVGTSFYSFCAKYSRIVFALEYKKFKKQNEYLYYEDYKGVLN